MKNISIWSYAVSFWKRDLLFSLFAGIFSIGIFFFLILSLRLQFAESGSLSLSSIEGLQSSPDLLFYLALFSLAFLLLSTVFPRMSDLGVMMAVGGNPWVCVSIHIHLVFLMTFPSFAIADFLNYAFISGHETKTFWTDFLQIQAYSLLSYIGLVFITGIPSVFLATLKDPYSAIRRIK